MKTMLIMEVSNNYSLDSDLVGGWPIDCFEISIPSHLKCALCLKILRDPVALPCPHLFCKICIKQNSHCPICDVDIMDPHYPIIEYFNNEITSLPFLCPYKNRGCSWKGTIGANKRNIISHFQNDCEWGKSEPCKKCGYLVKGTKKNEHEANCHSNVSECEYCNSSMTLYDLFIHQAIGKHCEGWCENREKCIYENCDAKIPRGELYKHLQECQFHEVIYYDGTATKIPYKFLEQYINNNLSMKREYIIEDIMSFYETEELKKGGYVYVQSDPHIYQVENIENGFVTLCKKSNQTIITRYVPLENLSKFPSIPISTYRGSNFSPSAAECIKNKECSQNAITQPLFICHTCTRDSSEFLCCILCAKICHNGHKLEQGIDLSITEAHKCACKAGRMYCSEGKVNCQIKSSVSITIPLAFFFERSPIANEDTFQNNLLTHRSDRISDT